MLMKCSLLIPLIIVLWFLTIPLAFSWLKLLVLFILRVIGFVRFIIVGVVVISRKRIIVLKKFTRIWRMSRLVSSRFPIMRRLVPLTLLFTWVTSMTLSWLITRLAGRCTLLYGVVRRRVVGRSCTLFTCLSLILKLVRRRFRIGVRFTRYRRITTSGVTLVIKLFVSWGRRGKLTKCPRTCVPSRPVSSVVSSIGRVSSFSL